MLDRLRAVPGVVAAATTLNAFVPGFAFQTLVHVEGRPTPDGQPHTVLFRRVSAGYFDTLRIRRVSGRDFAPGDGADAPGVAIVSRVFADRFWPGENAIGRRLRRNAAAANMLTVVGVVDDVADAGIAQPVQPTLYVPYSQGNPGQFPVALVVRTAGDPLASAAAVRAAVLSVDAAQPIDRVTTLERFMADSLGPQRFRATLLLVLAGLGLVLASVGIYGITARSVEERRREMAVRLALGAAPGAVWRLVVGHALVAVLVGMAAGGAGAAAASSLLVSWLPGLDIADPWAALVAVAGLAVSAVLAAAWPAWRAAGVSPALPLRGE
jgi:predicted permease